MRETIGFQVRLFLLAFAILLGPGTGASPPAPLWMQVAGEGTLSVVFISGNGNDHRVWADIEPQVRSVGVRTVIYDRAGLGQSPLKEGAYHVADEAAAMLQTLSAHGVDGPLLIVAHSYGGLIATLTAHENPAVKGMVFVDALLPADLSPDVVAGVLAEYTPRFAGLEAAAPALAKAIIPIVQGYPETADYVQSVPIAASLPFIDITAGTTWVSAEDDIAHVRKVHAAFVSASTSRTAFFLPASSHNVMRDNPASIIKAVKDMVIALGSAS